MKDLCYLWVLYVFPRYGWYLVPHELRPELGLPQEHRRYGSKQYWSWYWDADIIVNLWWFWRWVISICRLHVATLEYRRKWSAKDVLGTIQGVWDNNGWFKGKTELGLSSPLLFLFFPALGTFVHFIEEFMSFSLLPFRLLVMNSTMMSFMPMFMEDYPMSH